jgi:two-component system, OmpR family, alkaline phosphatase synthesis response regulator PhoP
MAWKVLIAEDEPNIVTSLEFLLKHHYEVRVARDGEEAVRVAESFIPDVVLLDVMMPGRNGFEVCRVIRGNPALRLVKIVMLTARGRDIERHRGLGLGADAYVTKPFSTKELLARIRELLPPESSRAQAK